MAIATTAAAALLAAHRTMLRGTRTRRPARSLPLEVAGYFYDGEGRRSIGQLQADLAEAVARASLSPEEEAVLRGFYGIGSYPMDISGGAQPLVGRIAGRQRRILGRSAIIMARDRAVDLIAEVLPARPREQEARLEPEPDVTAQQWFRHPQDPRVRALATRVGHDAFGFVLRMATLFAALEFTSRAGRSAQIHTALASWGERELELELLGPSAAPEAEERNAANAALAVCAWSLLHDVAEMRRLCERGRQAALPDPPVLSATPVTVVRHPIAGELAISDVDREALLSAASLVVDGADPGGELSDLILASLDSPAAVAGADAEMVLWSVARGQAAVSNPQAIGAARRLLRLSDDITRRVDAFCWAAHTMSMRRNHAAAVALVRASLTVLKEHEVVDPKLLSKRAVTEVVLSGVELRRANALLDAGAVSRAIEAGVASWAAVQRSDQLLRAAFATSPTGTRDRFGADWTDVVAHGTRRVDVLLLFESCRRLGVEVPVTDPLAFARLTVTRLQEIAHMERFDDYDSAIARARVASAVSALHQVDDSP